MSLIDANDVFNEELVRFSFTVSYVEITMLIPFDKPISAYEIF